MQTYDSYKDSGEKWLGKIPSHWEIRRSKFLWKETDCRTIYGSEQLLSVSQYDGVRESNEESRSESLVGYKLVHKDELVINIMLAWLGGLGVSNFDGIVSPAYCVYKLLDKQNPRFLHYLYRTPLYLAEFARHSTGIVPSRWRMYSDDFGDVLTILPPMEEQNRMVQYLDEQTSKIDKAIAQQQKMIDLLNERKRIIIQKAVTKGLDSNAPMKVSDDLLDSIPAHWKWEKLKYNCSIWGRIGFRGYSNEDLVDELSGAITLSPTNIIDGKMNYDKCSYLSWKKYYESPEIMVKVGDVIFVKTASVGKSAYIDWMPKETTVNPQIAVFKDIKCNPIFLSWVLQTNYLQEQVENSKAGSTIFTISQEKIGNYKLCLPPRVEQDAIVDYLKKETESIDYTIRLKRNIISILKERKQIIIDEVVTGKIKI